MKVLVLSEVEIEAYRVLLDAQVDMLVVDVREMR